MAMVHAQYPMTLPPATVTFLMREAAGSTVIQRVNLTDSFGAPGQATYLMRLQQDKSLRISACVVVPDPQRLVT